ncbi:2-oxoglutarate and iron-dependent oxygenase domain-containing protein [Sphingomonas sp. HITSZ_GF]|uniref:isopenicillin N synthase family dioxygenase n=1 Tax=Sphingomonas sp. HITSZ_GF TaxID=3037247 RepID=UPI00240DC163|nr:2OG-Fe(II) oxygenase family protein [Sphingomonas sp. HITSZ_GF]MDG2533050.1 2-oxoglutarate and iron-dependent oxygenase domain-containing protein [Sphingomonas sp. HITSZ_GF]
MIAELQYDEAEQLALDTIPVIDFGPFLTGGAVERAAVAAEIDRACRQIGFFYLVNHGVPEALRQSVLNESRAFFARSFEEKMQVAPILDGQWCGYLPARGAAEGTKPGGSLTEEGRAKKTVSGGTLEQFNMMRVRYADDPRYGDPDPIYQDNRWPAGAPRFVQTMMVNQRALLSLSQELMRAFAIALGLDEEYFVALHRSPLATFGLNFYPKPIEEAPSGNVGVGAHCDASSFTVLLTDDVGGLEVQTRDGRWISAPVVPGAYVINIGDTMMGWTNGQFVSTLHRVVSRKPVDRFSATMFMNPDREVTVAPIEAFVDEANPPRYAPFANDDYMRGFFVKFYDSMFK